MVTLMPLSNATFNIAPNVPGAPTESVCVGTKVTFTAGAMRCHILRGKSNTSDQVGASTACLDRQAYRQFAI